MRIYSRKYQKVTGWWVYGHITPNGKIYIGYSGGKNGDKQCCDRWNVGHYLTTALNQYIQQYGWDNIKHIVFKDGLTKKQAELLEDLLITQATIDGWCINEQGSGGERRDNIEEYKRRYREEHREDKKKYYKEHFVEIQKYQKQWREEHKEQKQKYDKQYREEHKEELKERDKQYYRTHKDKWSTPESKIYRRVQNYIRYHESIETPLEAKNKYLEYGYIPSYIKNDDLK